jgi:hypothetical protein
MTDFKPQQTVYLPDGREAEYVMQNGTQHLVRVIREVPDVHDERGYSYPDEKITAATKVYSAAPVDVYDELIEVRKAKLAEVINELKDKQNELAAINKTRALMEKASEKYPDISDALDFIEGRITHVAQWSGYGPAIVRTVGDALTQFNNYGGRSTQEGIKLLCLFGIDTKGARQWKLNHYRDGGSSSWVQIWPARSENEARQRVIDLIDVALASWRSGDEKYHIGHIGIRETFEANPWIDQPEDWRQYITAQKAKETAHKIADLRAQIMKLEQLT